MKYLIPVIIWLMATPLLAANPSKADAWHSSVKLSSGGSGVVIHSEGIILTAKHIGEDEMVRVTFPTGKTCNAYRIHSTQWAEGTVVYDCEGRGYRHVTVAGKPPESGDLAYSYGYPQMGVIHHGTTKVRHQETTGWNKRENTVQFLFTDHLGSPGWSGGGLFNQHNEVIGLLTGYVTFQDDAEKVSIWITWADIMDCVKEAEKIYGVEAAPAPEGELVKDAEIKKIKLVMVTADWCAPCRKFKQDFAADRSGFSDKYVVQYIISHPQADQIPTFFVNDVKKAVGYHSLEQLAKLLTK